jgi:prepilin-type processing-associated H-X9-DG protein
MRSGKWYIGAILAILAACGCRAEPLLGGSERDCMNNMKQVGLCLRMYSGEDPKGFLPPKLSVLYPEYITDISILVCPVRGRRPLTAEQIDAQSDYVYTAPADLRGIDDTAPLLSDRDGNHGANGRHVLFADGHVERVP